MAILENLGLAIFIKARGDKLVEYDDPSLMATRDHDNAAAAETCTKYIEAIDSEKYSIALEVNDKYKWPVEKRFRLYFNITNRRKMVEDADKSKIEDDRKVIQHLGTIEIAVWRFRTRGEPRIPTRREGEGAELQDFSLAEKVLTRNAISHGTRYIPSTAGFEEHTTPIQYGDVMGNEPIATFVFKYRSRDSLKSEMVIPRSHSPVSIPPDPSISIEELPNHVLLRLARERVQQLNAQEIQGLRVKRDVKSEVKSEVKSDIKPGVDYVDLT
ncbi:hypothetical protein GQ53DRAFT_843678 [Thozetella sp. PMI_491]|nr:hypothetical protein GQ53DRAFT_843678 [Thozetella sp. PMI_491]